MKKLLLLLAILMLNGCSSTTPVLTQVQTIKIRPPETLLVVPVEPIKLEPNASFEDVLKVSTQNGLEWKKLREQVKFLIQWSNDITIN